MQDHQKIDIRGSNEATQVRRNLIAHSELPFDTHKSLEAKLGISTRVAPSRAFLARFGRKHTLASGRERTVLDTAFVLAGS
jgi:hypothetical protein